MVARAVRYMPVWFVGLDMHIPDRQVSWNVNATKALFWDNENVRCSTLQILWHIKSMAVKSPESGCIKWDSQALFETAIWCFRVLTLCYLVIQIVKFRMKQGRECICALLYSRTQQIECVTAGLLGDMCDLCILPCQQTDQASKVITKVNNNYRAIGNRKKPKLFFSRKHAS